MATAHPSYHLVIGLGRSGMSMARFLSHIGKTVVATDMDAAKTNEAKELETLGIETQIGFHDQQTFNKAAVLVPSPGIPVTIPYIQNALKAGAKLSSELDIFHAHNTLPVIAVTGTNGKTTVTSLIGEMLQSCKINPFVGGNIGTPLVEQLMDAGKTDIIVAEISSFQLDIASRFRPDIGVLLNISEDHMDRYDTFADYERSKWSLLTRQSAKDTAVANRAISGFSTAADALSSRMLAFSSKNEDRTACAAAVGPDYIDIQFEGQVHSIDTTKLTRLPGTHNHENIAAALLACLAAGADLEGLKEGLSNFKPPSHRISWVDTIDNVAFYDDSKATNTDAVIRALECFEEKIILILGGREKGTDFSLLIPAVSGRVKQITAIGESRQKIADTFNSICPVILAEDMADAVGKSFAAAAENEIVLLSPACASFDMYENYAQRGNDFAGRVRQLHGMNIKDQMAKGRKNG